MATKAVESDRSDDTFWRDFPTMTDYFSPGIVPLIRSLGLGSKEVMHDFGEYLGRTAAAKLAHLSLREMMTEFSRIWEEFHIGQLTVEEENPLEIQISNCSVCGQLQGTGEMFECAFHEGFLQGALSARVGRPVSMSQKTNYEGDAGTWCRRLVADISV